MTGERGFDRDTGGLFVTDFADEDDVGVLPEEGPQRAGEGDAEMDLLGRMRTPGAMELLSAYEKLPAESRSSLLGFLRSLAAPEPAGS